MKLVLEALSRKASYDEAGFRRLYRYLYRLKEDHVVSVDVHNTLTRTLEELKGYDNIFQCHRSFAVNVNNISSAKGNSNGYQLKLDKCADIIPVSRSFVPQFKTYLT